MVENITLNRFGQFYQKKKGKTKSAKEIDASKNVELIKTKERR